MTFIQDVGFCYNGSKVTYHTVSHRYQTHLPGWTYDELTSESHDPSPGTTWWRDAATARFKLCIVGGIGCVAEVYPWINTVVYATGATQGSGSW